VSIQGVCPVLSVPFHKNGEVDYASFNSIVEWIISLGNKSALFRSLAMSYILPSSYRDHYEEIAKGLGKFHYDAVCIWADKNL